MTRSTTSKVIPRSEETVEHPSGGSKKREATNVLEELAPGQRLAVDANGRFDTETAIAYAEAQAH